MTSTELTPTSVIEQYRGDFNAVLPTHMRTDQWLRLTTGLFRRDRKLAEILQRNPGSVLSALLNAARLGLEVGETYHLVPFKGEVVGIADYTGLIELMYRAGAVASVKAEVVHARDHFAFDPGMDRPDHRPDWFGDRGEIMGAYAYAEMKDGSTSKVVIRSRAEIDKVRATSKSAGSASSPWNQWYDRMALKTVVRELAKFVPTSAEYLHHQAAGDPSGELTGRPAADHAPMPLPETIPAEVIDQDDPAPDVDPDTGEILEDHP